MAAIDFNSHKLRTGLPELPQHMRQLPIDHRGYPVPWFTPWVDGVPDFRYMDGAKLAPAIRESRCWICGGKLGTKLVFVSGPIIALNQQSAEPPNHLSCAEFAVRSCPWMMLPKAQRRSEQPPQDEGYRTRYMMASNPGMIALWITKTFQAHHEGVFTAGPPSMVYWWTQGRPATREEVIQAVTQRIADLFAERKDLDNPQMREHLAERLEFAKTNYFPILSGDEL